MASAPGRLDFMGGVGDYSGGLVLQVATAATTSVSLSSAACEAGSAVVSLRTASFGAEELPLPWLLQWESSTRALPLSERLGQVRAYLQSQGRPRWVFYVYGCVAAFLGETGWLPEAACSLAVSITSRVPLSQGVSSSASIEVAMLRALRSHSGAPLPDLRLAHVGQAVENFCAGAPCGLMDQLASSLGQAGQVLPILCRPDAVSPLVALPPGVLVVGWPSGAEHALDGASPYALARAATFMAKKALEAALGRKLQHITELLPSQLAAALHAIPEAMTGQAFLEAFGGVDDALSTIVPSHTYSLRAGAQFPVQESFRCSTALSLLKSLAGEAPGSPAIAATLTLVGELMRQTHRGYTSIGLGAPELDEMLEALDREIGVQGGVYGARISGGGSGGTMAILCEERALPAITALATRLTFGKPFPGLIS